jgi:hypothetical protein
LNLSELKEDSHGLNRFKTYLSKLPHHLHDTMISKRSLNNRPDQICQLLLLLRNLWRKAKALVSGPEHKYAMTRYVYKLMTHEIMYSVLIYIMSYLRHPAQPRTPVKSWEIEVWSMECVGKSYNLQAITLVLTQRCRPQECMSSRKFTLPK